MFLHDANFTQMIIAENLGQDTRRTFSSSLPNRAYMQPQYNMLHQKQPGALRVSHPSVCQRLPVPLQSQATQGSFLFRLRKILIASWHGQICNWLYTYFYWQSACLHNLDLHTKKSIQKPSPLCTSKNVCALFCCQLLSRTQT